MRTRTCPICGYSLEQDVEYEKSIGFDRAAYQAALEAHFASVHRDFWSWERNKRKVGIGLGIVTAAVSTIGLYSFFVFVLHLDPGEIPLIIAFVGVIVPIMLIYRRGTEHFKAQWQQAGKSRQPTTLIQNTSGPDLVKIPQETDILNLANSLVAQLEISNSNFSTILYQTITPPPTAPVPGDSPNFRAQTIYLSPTIRGKLSIDELKPLIAAALMNYRGLRPRKIRSLLELNIMTITVYILAWFALPPFFPTTTSCANTLCAINNVAWDVLVIALPFLALGLIVGNVLLMRRFNWIADKETAVSFGKDQLIASLKKVSDASPSDSWIVQRRIRKLTQLS